MDRTGYCTSRAPAAYLGAPEWKATGRRDEPTRRRARRVLEEVKVHHWPWPVRPGCRFGGCRAGPGASGAQDASLESSSLESCRTSLRAHEAQHTLSCAGGGHCTLRTVAHRAKLPTWRTGPAPDHQKPETPAWRAAGWRDHEAARTPCAGGGRGTLLAVARLARLLPWRTGPAPAHPEPEAPARRLQRGE